MNPVIWADAPDPDIVRVDDTYYMATTSMHLMPGSPIMKSTDLVNWEMVGYPYERLEENDPHNLRNGMSIYGEGSWANSLKYHKGKFYLLFGSLDMWKTYLFSADDPAGVWERTEFYEYMHDPALFFDDDDKAYIIFGSTDLRIRELTADYMALNPAGLDKTILISGNPGMEGAHAYKIGGKYYICTFYWEKGGIRQQLVYRADKIDGPYEGRVVLADTTGCKNHGIAQGGLIDTPDGNWYAMLFQDHDAVGRIPVLVPVRWEDGWPVYGDEQGRVPLQPIRLEAADTGSSRTELTISDEFDGKNITGSTRSPAHILGASSEEIELAVNGDFKAGTYGWTRKGNARFTIVLEDYPEGTRPVGFISKRPVTSAGIEQNFNGKIRPGNRYTASFKVKYMEGPGEKTFILTARKMRHGEVSFLTLVSGVARKNEWTEVTGAFAIEDHPDVLDLSVETPWTPVPDPVKDTMDFFVRDISVKLASPPLSQAELFEAMPGDSILGLQWQWNHNPDNTRWSLMERGGFLRLKTGAAVSDIRQARNVLTQRGIGPRSSGWVAMDTDHMRNGDYAGLAAFQLEYGYVGVTIAGPEAYLIMVDKGEEKARLPLAQNRVGLRVDFDFILDRAKFYYSYDELNWTAIGTELSMRYTLPHFVGYRFGLFNYATIRAGGYVDFDYFRFRKDEEDTQ